MRDDTTHAAHGDTDPRVAELQALALEEGLRLPMPINLLLWLEDRGCIVDLLTGKVLRPGAANYPVGCAPTDSGKAVAHLLQNHEGGL